MISQPAPDTQLSQANSAWWPASRCDADRLCGKHHTLQFKLTSAQLRWCASRCEAHRVAARPDPPACQSCCDLPYPTDLPPALSPRSARRATMPEVAGPTQLHFLTTSKSIAELWPFAAAEIDERPVFRPCRQFLPDWGFQNIIC